MAVVGYSPLERFGMAMDNSTKYATQVSPDVLLETKPGVTVEDLPTGEEIKKYGGVKEAMSAKERQVKRTHYQQALAKLNTQSQQLHNKQMQALEFAKKAVVKQQV